MKPAGLRRWSGEFARGTGRRARACGGRPRRDGGHIKLWSRWTLSKLLAAMGFEIIQFRGAGRLPYLWMTMGMSEDRPV
jgi:hypothetical protein